MGEFASGGGAIASKRLPDFWLSGSGLNGGWLVKNNLIRHSVMGRSARHSVLRRIVP